MGPIRSVVSPRERRRASQQNVLNVPGFKHDIYSESRATILHLAVLAIDHCAVPRSLHLVEHVRESRLEL